MKIAIFMICSGVNYFQLCIITKVLLPTPISVLITLFSEQIVSSHQFGVRGSESGNSTKSSVPGHCCMLCVL